MSAPRNPAASTLGMTATPGAPDPTTAATPFAAVDDASLVRRAQAGDRDAFVALYRRHVDDVYGFALRQLGSVQDAEDVTSETFLKVVAALATFDGRASFRTWLFAVARNQLRDRWRSERRRPRTVAFDDALAAEPGACDAADGASDGDGARGPHGASTEAAPTWPDGPVAALGRTVLDGLPSHYRRVLELRIGHGRSIRDVAEAMQTSPGNVKVLQHRALRRAALLASRLAPGDPPLSPTAR